MDPLIKTNPPFYLSDLLDAFGENYRQTQEQIESIIDLKNDPLSRIDIPLLELLTKKIFDHQTNKEIYSAIPEDDGEIRPALQKLNEAKSALKNKVQQISEVLDEDFAFFKREREKADNSRAAVLEKDCDSLISLYRYIQSTLNPLSLTIKSASLENYERFVQSLNQINDGLSQEIEKYKKIFFTDSSQLQHFAEHQIHFFDQKMNQLPDEGRLFRENLRKEPYSRFKEELDTFSQHFEEIIRYKKFLSGEAIPRARKKLRELQTTPPESLTRESPFLREDNIQEFNRLTYLEDALMGYNSLFEQIQQRMGSSFQLFSIKDISRSELDAHLSSLKNQLEKFTPLSEGGLFSRYRELTPYYKYSEIAQHLKKKDLPPRVVDDETHTITSLYNHRRELKQLCRQLEDNFCRYIKNKNKEFKQLAREANIYPDEENQKKLFDFLATYQDFAARINFFPRHVKKHLDQFMLDLNRLSFINRPETLSALMEKYTRAEDIKTLEEVKRQYQTDFVDRLHQTAKAIKRRHFFHYIPLSNWRLLNLPPAASKKFYAELETIIDNPAFYIKQKEKINCLLSNLKEQTSALSAQTPSLETTYLQKISSLPLQKPESFKDLKELLYFQPAIQSYGQEIQEYNSLLFRQKNEIKKKLEQRYQELKGFSLTGEAKKDSIYLKEKQKAIQELKKKCEIAGYEADSNYRMDFGGMEKQIQEELKICHLSPERRLFEKRRMEIEASSYELRDLSCLKS